MNKELLTRGPYITTFSNKEFYINDPREEDICIEDIAHALSQTCRFGGHCHDFFSVAEHCVILSNIVSEENALWALLHDAGEAYLTDMPRPFKRDMVDFINFESLILETVASKYGLDYPMPKEVFRLDKAMCYVEKPFLWNKCDNVIEVVEYLEKLSKRGGAAEFVIDPHMNYKPLKKVKIQNLLPKEAEQLFMDRFNEIKK